MYSRFVFWGLLGAMFWLFLPRADALILQGADDANYNTSAPTGIYENSGWQYQGFYGGGLGTVISPTQFITAKHLGLPETFVYDSITYSVDVSSAVLIGSPDSDLMILTISEGTFSQYAALYDGVLSTGMELVSHGRGAARGDMVYVEGEAIGWVGKYVAGDLRWGVNHLDQTVTIQGDVYLVAGFDQAGGPNEFGFTAGDSGGGTFVYDEVDGRWELVGVNYAVSGPYRFAPDNPGAFLGAFFDTTSLYEFDGANWVSSHSSVSLNYISNVSTQVTAIQAVLVPEPGSGLVVMCGFLWLLGRRRR